MIRPINLIDRPCGYKAGPQDLTDVMRSIGLLPCPGDNNHLLSISGLRDSNVKEKVEVGERETGFLMMV